ncbi:DUF4231 domain-containing protein [Nonomuraea sp. NPDC050451]|uniref:DUF4231 domain-containing protein n=1 Tax=Nonomuraea sp. NPDC050451 TaxID=3364364 RepID=UPI0037BA8ED3
MSYKEPDLANFKNKPFEEQYLASVEHERLWTRRAGNRDAVLYRWTRTISLICAAATPVLAATALPRWTMVITGALVVVIEGFLQVNQLNLRAAHRWTTAGALGRLLHRYQAQEWPDASSRAKHLMQLVKDVEDVRAQAFANNTARMQLAAEKGSMPEPSKESREKI